MRFLWVLLLAGLMNFPILGASKGKILVVFSSEDKITVIQKDGKPHGHATGFFLTELMIPLKALKKEGYTPVYASPEGGKVTIAATSFLRFNHPRQGIQPPRGHVSVWMEDMKIPPATSF